MTKSPSPSVDEVAEDELCSWFDTLQSCLETFWSITEPGTDSRLLAEGAMDAAQAIAAIALVSPPQAGSGEPIAWTDKNGLEFLARGYGIDVSAEKHGTRDIPLYANHEARGDGVRVRNLKWRDYEDRAYRSSDARTLIGLYSVYQFESQSFARLETPMSKSEQVFDTIDLAKAAAQAHFDAEIRKQLLPSLGDGRAKSTEP